MPIRPVPHTTVTSALQLGDRNGTSGADAAGLLNEACAAGLTVTGSGASAALSRPMKRAWLPERIPLDPPLHNPGSSHIKLTPAPSPDGRPGMAHAGSKDEADRHDVIDKLAIAKRR